MALKTRQLDFSVLDNRSYLYNERVRRNEAIKDFANNMTNLLLHANQQKVAAQRQKQVDIAEGLSFDTNITSNYIVDKAIADYWEKNIKTPWVRAMQSKRGGVTAFDKNTLEAQKQGLIRMANAGKAFTNNIENMKKMMADPKNKGLYEFDFDEVQRLLQDLDDGQIGLEDFVTSDFSQNYDSGLPFVNLKALDPEKLNRIGMDAFKKSTMEKGQEFTVEKLKGNQKFSTTEQEITYGDYDKWTEEQIAGMKARPDYANYAKYIGANLSDKEKEMAAEMYPQEDISGSFVDYYYKDKIRGQWEGELAPTDIGKGSIKPSTKSAGITFLFGGQKATEDNEVAAQATKVEGNPFQEYIEFAKASPKIKMVKGVTVKGASLLIDGESEDPADITTPKDYEVIGYDKGEDVVLLRNKVLTKNGVTQYETYKAPRQGNEHFLKGLVSDETMRELEKAGAANDVSLGPEFWQENQ